MANGSIANTKGWFSLSSEDQNYAAKQVFAEKYKNGKSALYNKATPADRIAMEQAYIQSLSEDAYNSQHHPDIIAGKAAQEDTDNSSTIFNWGRQIVDSHKDLGRRLDLFQQVMSDDPNTAATAEKYISKKRTQIQTQETKELTTDLKVGFDTWKNDGFFNKVKGLVQIAGAAAANPVGVMDVAAQSMSSMTSMGLGAAGGGAAGALAGPLGALWGGRAGAAGAGTIDAASAKFSEKLTERLEELKLTPTASNISEVLADKEWFDDAKKKSLLYGGSLSLADQATAGMVTKFAELPMKAARNAARAALTEANHVTIAAAAQVTGKTLAKTTDDFVDVAASAALKARSFKAKLVAPVTRYVGEVASEPISEAIGTASIGDENTIENLTMETLGGIGTGPFGTAINQSLYGTKLAADKTIATGKDIINSTPETRAAAKEHKAAMKETTALADKPAESNYKAKIASIDSESDEFIGLTDATNKATYNPKKAIDVLANTIDATPDTLNKALDIADAYMDSLTPLSDKRAELKNKETRTYAEEQELKNVEELLTTKNKFAESLYDTATILHARVTGKVAPGTPIDTVNDPIATVMDKLGSRGTRNTTLDQLETISKMGGIDSESSAITKTLIEAKTLRQKIEEQQISKSTDAVSLDIYNGKRGSSFKGIDAYQQGIVHFLSPKEGEVTPRNEAKAKVELDGLKAFAKRHAEKTAIYNDLFKTYQKGEAFTPEQNQAIATLQKENPNFRVAGGLLKVIPNMQQEVKALNSEVKLAEMTYKRLTNQTNTTTSTPVSSPATEAVAKPTAAPVVTVTPVIAKPASQSTPSSTASNKSVSVVTTPPVTNPVVTSEPASDVTQTTRTVESAKATLDSGKSITMGITENRELQKQLYAANYARVLDKSNPDPAKHTATFKQSVEQESKAKAETSNPSPVVAPVAASKPKDILAPALAEVVPPTASQEAEVGSNEWLRAQRVNENLYGDTEGKVDNGTLTSYAKDGNKSAQAELDRRYINDAVTNFKEWATPTKDSSPAETIESLEGLVEIIDRHESFANTGKREAFKQQVINKIAELQSNQIENQSVEQAPLDALEGIDTEVKINMGTEAEPNFMTKEEALKDHEQKQDEAVKLLECTKK